MIVQRICAQAQRLPVAYASMQWDVRVCDMSPALQAVYRNAPVEREYPVPPCNLEIPIVGKPWTTSVWYSAQYPKDPARMITECVICGHWHRYDYAGDCRNDDERFNDEEDYLKRALGITTPLGVSLGWFEAEGV